MRETANKDAVESQYTSKEALEKALVDKEHEDTPVDDKHPPKAPKASKADIPKMYKLTINADDSAEGKSDVFVALNFHSYQIQRDKEVIVPEGVIEILKNTVADTKDANGNNIRIPRFNMSTEVVK